MLHEKNPPGLIYDVLINAILDRMSHLVIGLNDEEKDEQIKTLLTELLTIVTDIFKDERFLSHAYIVRGYMIDLQEIQELKNKSPLKELLEAAKTDTNHEFPSAGLHSPVQKFSRYRLLLETVKKSFEGTGIEVTMLDDAIKHMNNATMIQNSVTEEGFAEPSSEPMSEDEDEYEVFDEDEDEDGYGVVDVGTLAMGLTEPEVNRLSIEEPLKVLIVSQRQKKMDKEEEKVKEQLEGLEASVLDKQVASASGVIQQMREILESSSTGSQSPSQSSSKTGKEFWKKMQTVLHVTTAFGEIEKHEEVMDEAEEKLESLMELNGTRGGVETMRGESSPPLLPGQAAATKRETVIYSRQPVVSSPSSVVSSPSSVVSSPSSVDSSPSPSPPGELSPLSPVELSSEKEKEDKIERLKLNRYFEERKTKCEQISDTVELHAELSKISGVDESSIEKLRKKLIEELKKKLGIKSKALHRRVAPPSSGTTPIEEIHASPDKIDKYLNMLIKQQQKIKKFLESIPRVFAVGAKVFVIDETYRVPYRKELTVIENPEGMGDDKLAAVSSKKMAYMLPLQSVIPFSDRIQWMFLKFKELQFLTHILEGTWRDTLTDTSFKIKLNCGGAEISSQCSAVFDIYSGSDKVAESTYFSDGYLKITQSNKPFEWPLYCVGVFNHLGLYWTCDVWGEFKVSHWKRQGDTITHIERETRTDIIARIKREHRRHLESLDYDQLFSRVKFLNSDAVTPETLSSIEGMEFPKKWMVDTLMSPYGLNAKSPPPATGGNNKRSKRTKRSKRSRVKRSRVKRSKRTKRSKRSKRLRTKRSRVKRTNRRRNTRRR